MKIRIVETIASIAPASVSSSLLADAATAEALSDVPPRPFSSAAAFVNEWIGPGHKPAPVVRDFTFKAVIGEPEW